MSRLDNLETAMSLAENADELKTVIEQHLSQKNFFIRATPCGELFILDWKVLSEGGVDVMVISNGGHRRYRELETLGNLLDSYIEISADK